MSKRKRFNRISHRKLKPKEKPYVIKVTNYPQAFFSKPLVLEESIILRMTNE